MFDALKNWITSIVVAVIFMALLDMILPSNSLKKYAKLVLGLIIIIIIITPVFNVLSKNVNIEAKVSSYIKEFDADSSVGKQNTNNYINKDTIKVFKENLKSRIEEAISAKCEKSYKVEELLIVEDQSASDFLDVKAITLRGSYDTGSIKKVAKVNLGNNSEEEYYWDKEAANVLGNEFNIKNSVIKFVR